MKTRITFLTVLFVYFFCQKPSHAQSLFTPSGTVGVSSSGAFNSILQSIQGANFEVIPNVVDRFGGHDVHTYTTEELREQNPELFQYFVDQGILNDDGSLKEDKKNNEN